MLLFELLHRDVDSLEDSNLDKEFIKSRHIDSVFSSYKDTLKSLKKNVTKMEFDALVTLRKNKNIIAQKVDKGTAVNILSRKDYVCKIKNILNDRSKFQKVYIDLDKILNHIIHIENRVTVVLKNPRDKKQTFIEQYKYLSTFSSIPGIMCGLAKVRKIVTGGFPFLRRILYATGTQTYTFSKF